MNTFERICELCIKLTFKFTRAFYLRHYEIVILILNLIMYKIGRNDEFRWQYVKTQVRFTNFEYIFMLHVLQSNGISILFSTYSISGPTVYQNLPSSYYMLIFYMI